MDIFTFTSYQEFLKSHIKSLPNRGRGEISKMAKALGIQQSLLSQILNGVRDLSVEQAFGMGVYLQLTPLEAEYFSTAVGYSRAGNHAYKLHLKKKLADLKSEASKVEHRFEHERRLSEEERSIFYSSWIYSAVRLFTSTSASGKSAEEVAKQFEIPRQKAMEILMFLSKSDLVSEKNGFYFFGTQRTFLERGSPYLNRHHQNWRNKAIQYAETLSEEEVMFTSPVSLSRADFNKIKSQVLELLKDVSTTVKDSPAEEIACLNIDLFWIRK